MLELPEKREPEKAAEIHEIKAAIDILSKEPATPENQIKIAELTKWLQEKMKTPERPKEKTKTPTPIILEDLKATANGIYCIGLSWEQRTTQEFYCRNEFLKRLVVAGMDKEDARKTIEQYLADSMYRHDKMRGEIKPERD